MSYQAGESLVLGIIREHAAWTTQNTARADWRQLDAGKSSYFAVLRPGSATFATDSLGGLGTVKRKRTRVWRTEILVYQRYIKDGDSATDLQALVSTLAAHLEKYPKLGDTTNTVRAADVAGVGEMQQIQMVANGPMWLMWPIFLDWIEENEVSES